MHLFGNKTTYQTILRHDLRPGDSGGYGAVKGGAGVGGGGCWGFVPGRHGRTWSLHVPAPGRGWGGHSCKVYAAMMNSCLITQGHLSLYENIQSQENDVNDLPNPFRS